MLRNALLLAQRDALDVDLDLVGVFERLRIVAVDVGRSAMSSFCSSVFSRSMAVSASALNASCSCTCITSCVPPLRSSPRWMFFFQLAISSAFDFGNADNAVDADQDHRDDDDGLNLDVAIHGLIPSVGLVASDRVTLLHAFFSSVTRARHRAARHLDLDVVRLDAQYQRIIIVDR